MRDRHPYAVLCDPSDGPAFWAVDRLRARLGHVLLVMVDTLGLSPQLQISINDAAIATSVVLPDGTAFGSATVATILNRVRRAPLTPVAVGDADYAAAEMTATMLAFLSAFGSRAINRPDPFHLYGRELSTPGWLTLAAKAGLPVHPWRMDELGLVPLPSPVQRGIVIGNEAFGCASEIGGRAVALARMADLELLGLDFDEAGRVVGATAWPNLSCAGEAGADALAALLESRA